MLDSFLSPILRQGLEQLLARPIGSSHLGRLMPRWQRLHEAATQVARIRRLNPNDPKLEAADSERSARAAEASGTARGERDGLPTDGSQARQNWLRADAFVQTLPELSLPTLMHLNRLHLTNLPELRGPSGQLRSAGESASADGNVAQMFMAGSDVAEMTQQAFDWLAAPSTQRRHPIESASLMYQRLLSIHLFHDGNQRSMRHGALDLPLRRAGFLPPLLGARADAGVTLFAGSKTPPEPHRVLEVVTEGMEQTVRLYESHMGPLVPPTT